MTLRLNRHSLLSAAAVLALIASAAYARVPHRAGGFVANVDPLTQKPFVAGVPGVYSGCATPPAAGAGAVYYSDPNPASGNDSNDGSRAHPFASLHQMVLDGMFATDQNHSGPHTVGAGANDTLYLLPGDHGTVVFKGTQSYSEHPTSGTYDPSTGHIVFNFTPPVFWSVGNPVYFSSVTGTGAYADFLKQTYTVTAASSSQITLAGPTGHSASSFTGGLLQLGLDGFDFSTWLTIAGEPANPYGAVVTTLNAWGGKVAFRNFTVQSLNTTGQYTTAGGANGGQPQEVMWLVQNNTFSHDIVYDGLHLKSADDATVNGWAMNTWMTQRSSGLVDDVTNCLAITNNSFSNIGFGIVSQDSDKVLIAGNTINRFSDDGIDWGSSDMRIVNNDITNSIDDADGYHRDGAQGQPNPAGNNGGSNIEIDHNAIIRITDKTERTRCTASFLTCPASFQGIDNFSGLFSNVNVHDNVVVSNEGQQIALYGVSGGYIVNNIALSDDGYRAECPNTPDTLDNDYTNCGIATGVVTNEEAGLAVWYLAQRNSTDIITTGNYTSSFQIANNTQNWLGQTSGNTCLWSINNQCLMATPVVEPGTGLSATYNAGTGALVATLAASAPFTNGQTVTVNYLTGTSSLSSGAYDTGSHEITITMPGAPPFTSFSTVTLSGLTGTGAVSSLNGTWDVECIYGDGTGLCPTLNTFKLYGPTAGTSTITGGSGSGFVFSGGWVVNSVAGAVVTLAGPVGDAATTISAGGVFGPPENFIGTPASYPTQGVTITSHTPTFYFKKFDVPNASYDFRPAP